MINSVPKKVSIGLCLAIIFDTGIQLSWKAAVLNIPADASLVETAAAAFQQPLFYTAIVLVITQFINWLWVLSEADLSFAMPITALSYISVCSLSAMFLHENLSIQRLAGILLILVGVWFISQTKHNTINENVADNSSAEVAVGQ